MFKKTGGETVLNPLFIEGNQWVQILEKCWLEAQVIVGGTSVTVKLCLCMGRWGIPYLFRKWHLQ